MKIVCCICKKLVTEIDDGQNSVSHGMHESCGLDYYRRLGIHLTVTVESS